MVCLHGSHSTAEHCYQWEIPCSCHRATQKCTQGFLHARQTLSHRAISPAAAMFFKELTRVPQTWLRVGVEPSQFSDEPVTHPRLWEP